MTCGFPLYGACVRACVHQCDVFEMSGCHTHVTVKTGLWQSVDLGTTGSRFCLTVFELSEYTKITSSASDSGPSHINTLSAFSFCFLCVLGGADCVSVF